MNENYSYELKKILINYSNKKVEVENIGMEYLDELRNELVSFSFILNQAIKVNIENKTSEDIMNNIKTLTSNIGVNEIEISNIKNVTHSNEIRILMCMQSFIEDIINYYNIVHKELDEQSKIILKENLTTTLIKCGEKINEDLSYENLKEVAGLYYRFKTMADESINYCKNISRLN